MSPKTKTFDCIEMKRESQRRLFQEFETRRNEFDNYLDFIRAKAEDSDWVQSQRDRLHSRGHTPAS